MGTHSNGECSLVPPRLRLDARRAQLEHALGDDHGAAPAGRGEGVRLALGLLPRVQVDDLVAIDLVRELADEEHEGDDGHDPGQDHGDPLGRLGPDLEGREEELAEEERDERRRRLIDLERLNPEPPYEAREVELADRVAPRVLARVWPFFLLAGQALFLFLKPPR